MLKKNDIIELNITSATAEGSGVGKTDEGIAVFVPLSAVGDFLRVKILKVKKTYAFGKIEEIITPSKDRTEPDCECLSKCGGCVWRHIKYSAECDIKSQKVADAVTRIGGINTDIKPIIACDQTERYRNKAQFPVGRDKDGNLLIGFYAFHSHRIVNCSDCSLQPKIFSEVIEVTREFIELTNAYGNGYIAGVLCGLKFKISPFSFWQVNRSQAERLYGKAREYANLSGNEVLLDLYCGTGTIGLTMAKDCKKLIGVEIIDDAVKDARENAVNNGITNAEFICSDAANAAKELEQNGLKPDVIIVDPPRKGCGEELVNTIAEMKPDRVVYVSCDPATLARDLKYFDALGYKTVEVTPVDMFPKTAHVESVALLTINTIL